MIRFCPLASGSKGNAILLSTQEGNLLFDAGISAKTISERLQKLQLSIEDIHGILISHEHSDHIAGLKTLCFRHNIPLVTNYATAEVIVEILGETPRLHIFTTDEPFDFYGYHITPFSVQHDGIDPVAFTIEKEGKKIAICTDIGCVTPSVRHMLQGCHILYIEANHQPSMVHSSARPDIYKQRVLSKTGHLSNEACATLLTEVASDTLQHVYLAHLSSECNTPDVAKNIIQEALRRCNISVPIHIAYQHDISTMIEI